MILRSGFWHSEYSWLIFWYFIVLRLKLFFSATTGLKFIIQIFAEAVLIQTVFPRIYRLNFFHHFLRQSISTSIGVFNWQTVISDLYLAMQLVWICSTFFLLTSVFNLTLLCNHTPNFFHRCLNLRSFNSGAVLRLKIDSHGSQP